jgi:hypothetical protein
LGIAESVADLQKEIELVHDYIEYDDKGEESSDLD